MSNREILASKKNVEIYSIAPDSSSMKLLHS